MPTTLQVEFSRKLVDLLVVLKKKFRINKFQSN